VSGAVGAQTLSCSFGDLASGTSRTVVVTAVTSVGHCAAMPNLATASATNAASVQDPGSITCQTPVLSIVKTPDGQTINGGDTATFTIVVSNLGPGTAKSVTLSDPLPAGGGVNWTTVTANCSVSGAVGTQTLSCSFGDLAAGASVTVVVSAVTSAAACTTMPNLATASATNAASVTDPGSITCVPVVIGCPGLNPIFGLGDTSDIEQCAVYGGFDPSRGLAKSGVIISDQATKIVGDVCVGPCPSGSNPSLLLKATIDGDLRVDASCPVQIKPDLKVTGTIDLADNLTPEFLDATAACHDLAVLAPNEIINGNITGSFTITATKDGLNVIQLNGSILLNKNNQVLTFDAGGHTNVAFLINVTGTINCSSCVVNLVGVKFSDVLYNVIGPGDEIEINKPVKGSNANAAWAGTVLACERFCIQNMAKVFGSFFCGVGVKIYSGALICPKDPVFNP
jgi:uncharacterized repeat protein (TIGR01451 family)